MFVFDSIGEGIINLNTSDCIFIEEEDDYWGIFSRHGEKDYALAYYQSRERCAALLREITKKIELGYNLFSMPEM